MLEVLKNKRLYKTVAVVTRYFGGIKLGTGGLTRAYGGSVTECLQKADIIDMQKAVIMSVSPDYEGYSRLLKILNENSVSVIETNFDNLVTVKLAVKEDFVENFKIKIRDSFFGKLEINLLGCEYYAFR